MKELIEALQILLKYDNPDYPFNCEHDTLYIHIDADKVSKEDIEKLDKLGIFVNESHNEFKSYRYGSA